MKRKSFILYTDMVNVVRLLTPEQRGNLFLAIFDFADGKEPVFDDAILKIAFESIKLPLLRDNEKYENKSKANAENGKKGGRPRKDTDNQSDCNAVDNNPKNPVGYSETQNNPEEPKKADSDSDSDSVNDKDKDNKENLPANLFCDENLESGKNEESELKKEFEKFRKKYPGKKRGFEYEWIDFIKRCKKYKEVVPILNDAIDIQIIRYEQMQKIKNTTNPRLFIANWKDLSTWLNGGCWTIDSEQLKSEIDKDECNLIINKHEEIINGKRTYMRGENRVILPDDAPPRPNWCYVYSESLKKWVYQQ